LEKHDWETSGSECPSLIFRQAVRWRVVGCSARACDVPPSDELAGRGGVEQAEGDWRRKASEIGERACAEEWNQSVSTIAFSTSSCMLVYQPLVRPRSRKVTRSGGRAVPATPRTLAIVSIVQDKSGKLAIAAISCPPPPQFLPKAGRKTSPTSRVTSSRTS